jgi:hypothetical protein
MSPDLFTRLIDTIVATGPVAALLLIAVWHQTKGQAALIKQLNEEREERLTQMEGHMTRLEYRADTCEQDRRRMSEELVKLKVRAGLE